MKDITKEKDLIINYLSNLSTLKKEYIEYLKRNKWDSIMLDDNRVKFYSSTILTQSFVLMQDFISYIRYQKFKKIRCLKKEI